MAALLVAALLVAVLASACGGGGAGDSGFGRGGKVQTDFGGDDFAAAVALQADGKIVAAGSTGSDIALARYGRDGALDQGFGGDGLVRTDLGADDVARAVAIQGDGKIIVAGESSVRPDYGGSGYAMRAFALARFLPDGRIDESFGGRGKVVTSIAGEDSLSAVAVLPDGTIVAGGVTNRSDVPGSDFALVRLQPDGSFDESFGSHGKIVTGFGLENETGWVHETTDLVTAIAVQADGKLLAVGQTRDRFVALARYDENGTLDRSFGSGGKVVADFGGWAYAVALQGDGKIVVAGAGAAPQEGFVLARFTRTGSLDQSFGSAGRVLTHFGPEYTDSARAVALQDNGKILAAGESWDLMRDDALENKRFALARYTPNGVLDTSFGSDGKVLTGFGLQVKNRWDYASAAVIQDDGRIILAGGAALNFGRPGDFALARYTADGRLDQPPTE